MLGALPSHPKYNKQIVINLNNDPAAPLHGNLLLKALKHPIETYYIQLGIQVGVLQVLSVQQVQKNNHNIVPQPSSLAEAFSNLDHQTRIYIQGHSFAGELDIQTDDGTNSTIHLTILTQWLVSNIPAAIFPILSVEKPLANKLKISLLMCNAATATNKTSSSLLVNNSIAANLSYELKKQNLDCVVAARQGILANYLYKGKNYYKVVNPSLAKLFSDLNQQENTAVKAGNIPLADKLQEREMSTYYDSHDTEAKLLYYYEHGVQKVISAYEKNPGSSLNPAYVWKKDVFATINRCIERTKSAIKKQGLYNLLYAVTTKSDIHEIYALINNELFYGKPGQGYQVHTHNDFFSFGRTRTYLELESLLQRVPH